MLKTIICSTLFVVAMVPVALEQLFPPTHLSSHEMEQIVGGDIPLCGDCEIEEDTTLCGSPYGKSLGGAGDPIHDSCTYKGCVGGASGDCGKGIVHTGAKIKVAIITPNIAQEKWYDNDTRSQLCDYDIVCSTGDFDNTQSCQPAIAQGQPNFPREGKCFVPRNGGATGCRTCSAGPQTFPIQQRNRVDQKCIDCPFPIIE